MRIMTAALVLLPVFCLAGCGVTSVAKMGYKTVRGVDADAIPLETIPAGALAPYGTVQVGQVTTDVGPICPASLLTEVRNQMRDVFAERLTVTFPGAGRSLTIDVVCRYYKKKRRIGNEGRLDALVHLKDAETGRQVGRFYVEAISESPLHTGEDDMAEELAKEIAKHLVKLKRQD